MLWNFIIGGITGIDLSDVPADYDLHGAMLVTANFHYTLMGAGLTGAHRCPGLLVPEDDRTNARSRSAGFMSFWLVQIGFNVTFLGMFAVGLPGQPRRVEHYASIFATGNLVSSIGDYAIGLGMLVLLWAIVSSWRRGEVAPAEPVGGQDPRMDRAEPVPLENFEVFRWSSPTPTATGSRPNPSPNGVPVPAGARREPGPG